MRRRDSHRLGRDGRGHLNRLAAELQLQWCTDEIVAVLIDALGADVNWASPLGAHVHVELTGNMVRRLIATSVGFAAVVTFSSVSVYDDTGIPGEGGPGEQRQYSFANSSMRKGEGAWFPPFDGQGSHLGLEAEVYFRQANPALLTRDPPLQGSFPWLASGEVVIPSGHLPTNGHHRRQCFTDKVGVLAAAVMTWRRDAALHYIARVLVCKRM